ncbi:hypothetical protein ACFSC4_17970 [Deinococcus malanensis]|uniref:hypothetical protein n=1 Tax=Deinococcus malanensis TaxID=1706855 RepID=UPI0036453EFA
MTPGCGARFSRGELTGLTGSCGPSAAGAPCAGQPTVLTGRGVTIPDAGRGFTLLPAGLTPALRDSGAAVLPWTGSFRADFLGLIWGASSMNAPAWSERANPDGALE